MLVSLILLTSCDNPQSPSNLKNDLSSAATNSNAPMGKFVQTDCTPPVDLNATVTSFKQSANGEIILSVFDQDDNTPRAFSYVDGIWSEKEKPPIDGIISKNDKNISGIYDYTGNWWVNFTTEKNELKVFKFSKGENPQEIVIPYIQDSQKNGEEVFISNLQSSDNGDVCISIANLNNSLQWTIIDGKTGKVKNTIKPKVADYDPVLHENKLFTLDFQSKKENVYDTSTGEILSTHNIPLKSSPAHYIIDKDSQIAYVNSKGIHKVIPDGNLIQTMIDNIGYAYTDPNVSYMHILEDKKSGNYFMACALNGKLKVFNYSLDKKLPTNSSDKLYIWAFEDNSVVRATASVFAQEFPECEVNFEFGKTNESGAMTHEDIVRNLNTRLLAGDSPDVLFLDGLSIETLSSQGLLGEMDININKADYYENILNSFQHDGKTVAYPAFFQMPVLCSNKADLSSKNTLDEIAKLYQNDKLIFNNAYKDIFESFFYSSYSELFPDNKSVNEAAINKFLTATKAITNSQNITSELDPLGEAQVSDRNGSEPITIQLALSLMRFGSGKTKYATGILKNLSDAAMLFNKQKDVTIIPLLDGNYLCRHIASVPVNAKNKAMASQYIRILLSNDSVQSNNIVGGFSVKKSLGMKSYKIHEMREKNGEPPFLSDPTSYDWDKLIASFNKPCYNEVILYDIIYEQAKKLYSNETNVDTATTEIMKKLKLFLAEKR